jgi:pyruvate,water dikinase
LFSAELFKYWTYQVFAPGTLLRKKYNAFKELLAFDDACLDLVADIEEIAYGEVRADWAGVVRLVEELEENVRGLARALMNMSPASYMDLPEYLDKVCFYVRMGLDLPDPNISPPHFLSLYEAADQPELSGGKAHNVALMAAETYLNVPPGFVVTASAFNYFIEAEGLRSRLDDILSTVTLEDQGRLEAACEQLRSLILESEVPASIARDMVERATKLAGGGTVAVRSSAVAEDGELSFAGQYESLLGVAPENVVDAYKEVLASKYTPRALAYRIINGLADQETPMAVLFMPMVDARAAGVVYTLDMDRSQAVDGVMGVYCVHGVGDGLVSGRRRAEVWSFTREEEPLAVQEPDVPEPALSMEQALDVARAAFELEEMFGGPQDVEWAQRQDGKVFMLQSRPLQRERAVPPPRKTRPEGSTLLEGAQRASSGVAAGRVVHLRGGVVPESMPVGAIAVVEALLPQLASHVERLGGVVAEHGSRASHFASVAREFGLPVLIGVEDPFSLLPEETLVTVDADTGSVWEGELEELVKTGARARTRKNPAVARLNRTLTHITKLRLTDPESEEFSPSGCRSLHDLVRFCHEKGVAEMFSLVGKDGRGLAGAKKLESSLPLTMYVLDVDKGLFDAAKGRKTVTPDDFKCQSMWFLWRGLSSRDIIWDERMTHMDWEEFDRMAGGIFSLDDKLLASYAVLAEDYMHLMIRFGYHFSIVDVLCSPDPKQNYFNFRFKGGGGSLEQRRLRLHFLRKVLQHYNFITFAKGDMLDARLCRRAEPEMLQKLFVLGRLLARTRLMDMGLSGKEQVEELASRFIRETERVAREDNA